MKTYQGIILFSLIIFPIFGTIIHAGKRIDEIHQKEYQVWIKMTGNPNGLTFDEFQAWKGIQPR